MTLVEKYAKPVPRYTSYPTAPHFHAGVGNGLYAQWLGALRPNAKLSLYIHIPYCDRLCWFCGCHTKQVLRYEPVAKYLVTLRAEIAAVAARLGGKGVVTALHFGGGSPTMVSGEDMAALGALLRESFTFSPDAEISVEIDPNDMGPDKYEGLAAIGMTRASLGVQDFDLKVQQTINRLQSFEQTRDVVEGVRAHGARSVNLDVLYGLPHQTIETVTRTVDQVLSLRPDRIALFGYAHVPWMKKHQTMIDEAALPGAQSRFEQARAAAEQIVAAGYEAIGIDHFALPGDSLARAHRDGTLNRNFQGYTVDENDALIGFGASAIGRLPQGYVQNIVATDEYKRSVAQNGTAIGRGVAFTAEDELRGYVIEKLMCDFAFSRRKLREKFGAAAEAVLSEAALMLAADADGLIGSDGDRFFVTERGRPFVRLVAAGFDAYLLADGARYSMAV